MAFASTVHILDDENDDFDWDAAVREIDEACSRAETNPPTSSFSNPHFAPALPPTRNGAVSNNAWASKSTSRTNPKQSTLDKFIAKPGPVPPSIVIDEYSNGVGNGDVDGVSSVEIDPEAAKTWIYPVNVPLRDYQLAITRTALFSNTLVALPTGLGKTLIAAVVMHNYFRWFPEGKIVFAAPSRPLVMQQIEACHNIVGIPQEFTIDMTGQISPTKRAWFWKTKRVFFVTPQVLEKDIQAGTCLVRCLVCLVIDEAHRATGNFSYCVAVRQLMAVPVNFRILALTATPGSKHQAIQHVIDNLSISTLEYRNETDPDVSPYVHDRKIELIEVALGKDAVDINKQLLDVIHPYITRLSAVGLLQNRDYRTLSPPDLLNSRDRFRQAPPPSLPQNKYGEIEACFGGLITLYHIRKLLSSHGIRPAFEMLEEKLEQGPFARLMSKNEGLRKVKLSMQQSLSHGAPSPKLSKMLEVLVDHFKTKDPSSSRVIIFSNFRGSVRDIMNALTSIGNLVKATEFIGQSSGKALKGQSQKIQQAVLQEFRAGRYNVIVATSIGEEGLDIMEVDLVICFDANVSPLRMIQRMGRTGRQHDGRVVVLACEGSELKGYMRKQASSKAIKKHMHSGGTNSFNFHSSPRMIPHIFKPQVQFVELSIEQYVPRGRKQKDDSAMQINVVQEKLSVAEAALLGKYFQPAGETVWRPSLIAFPCCQALPSKVHKVMHSHRTDMLIDVMQHLRGLTFSVDGKSFFSENEVPGKSPRVYNIEHEDNNDVVGSDSPMTVKSQEDVIDFEVSPINTIKERNNLAALDYCGQTAPPHSYLFGSDFVSVDACGKVIILSVPLCPSKEEPFLKYMYASPGKKLNCSKKSICDLRTSAEDCKEKTRSWNIPLDRTSPQTQHWKTLALETSAKSNYNVHQGKTVDQGVKVSKRPTIKRNSCGIDLVGKSYDLLESMQPFMQNDECNNHFKDSELSPRLSIMNESGIVPESPISDAGALNDGANVLIFPELVSSVMPSTKGLVWSPLKSQINDTTVGSTPGKKAAITSPICVESQSTLLKEKNVSRKGVFCSVSPVAEETNTPLSHVGKCSSHRHLTFSSIEKSENVEHRHKLKRLRRVGDTVNKDIKNMNKEKSSTNVLKRDNFPGTTSDKLKCSKGKWQQLESVRAFIEEEAEVSSEAESSNSEEGEQEESCSYDDSFIDDRINPTAGSTEVEADKVDMMAVYRRSLLSQSPMLRDSSSSGFTPDHTGPPSREDESRSSWVKISSSSRAPNSDLRNHLAGKNSESDQMKAVMITGGISSTTVNMPRENETKHEMRKRKFSFSRSESIPVIDLEKKFALESMSAGNESFQQDVEFAHGDGMFDDDQFFATIDLDAVEQQAASILKNRSTLSVVNQDMKPNPVNSGLESSPSFDLGI